MNNVIIFEEKEFGQIRTAVLDGEPMFCLTDVCRALEIVNVGNVRQRLSVKGIHTADTPTNGGIQKMTFISEANLSEQKREVLPSLNPSNVITHDIC